MSSLRRPGLVLLAALILYSVTISPFTDYMRRKPVEEKLGYLPTLKVIRVMAADQKEVMGASLIMKVLMYFGGITMKQQEKIIAEPPDYVMMSRVIHGALQLDPYNMDGYYFAQAFLVWDAHQVAIANNLLDYGMKYRTWDWSLPFFAGFNSAYFLKDYAKAAEYFKRAGELSGSPLYINLTGRYLQESGKTGLAIGYLKTMIATSRNDTARKSFEIRLKAFEGVRIIEMACDRFREKEGRIPSSVAELLASGFLQALPLDPYGGQFYLEPDGKVATTSKFAFAGAKNEKRQNSGESHERH
jgi:tetratricopeptide (TPR) repeat protein